jgi:hypothetical protein
VHLTPFDWIFFACLGVSAIYLAADTAAKQTHSKLVLAQRFPPWLRTPTWNYLPLVLMIVAGLILTAKAAGLLDAAAPKHSAETRRPEPSATPRSAPPLASAANPIHDDAAKWRLTKNLRHLVTRRDDPVGLCEIVIVHLPTPYGETYKDDLSQVLAAVGWTLHDKLAQESPPRGLSIFSTETAKARRCREALTQRLGNDVQIVGGVGGRWLLPNEITPYMKACGNPEDCIQISIGFQPD